MLFFLRVSNEIKQSRHEAALTAIFKQKFHLLSPGLCQIKFLNNNENDLF